MAMTALQIIQEACKYVGLAVPTAVFASTQREHVELCSYLNEMARSIAFDGRDWTALIATATITGDARAITAGYDLPSNYKRMLKKASLWPSWTPFAVLTHYPDFDEWLGLQVQSFSPVIGGWTKAGSQLFFNPVVTAGRTIKFGYIKNAIVTGPDTTQFTADGDLFALNDRVLKLGLQYYWKKQKGQLYAEDMADFEAALDVEAGNDKGSNILTVGTRRLPMGVGMAYPGSAN